MSHEHQQKLQQQAGSRARTCCVHVELVGVATPSAAQGSAAMGEPLP